MFDTVKKEYSISMALLRSRWCSPAHSTLERLVSSRDTWTKLCQPVTKVHLFLMSCYLAHASALAGWLLIDWSICTTLCPSLPLSLPLWTHILSRNSTTHLRQISCSGFMTTTHLLSLFKRRFHCYGAFITGKKSFTFFKVCLYLNRDGSVEKD